VSTKSLFREDERPIQSTAIRLKHQKKTLQKNPLSIEIKGELNLQITSMGPDTVPAGSGKTA